MSIRIVTDSTADIPNEIAAELNIEVVPLNVHFGNDTFKDGIDLTTDAFFDKLINGPDFPSTSQPSIGEFAEVYEKIIQKGDEIVSAGGVVGQVTKVEDDFIKVEIAENIEIRVQKTAVGATLPKGTLKSLDGK